MPADTETVAKVKRTRFTGTIQLGTPAVSAPVTKSDVDLAEYRDLLTQSFQKVQAGNPQPAFSFTMPTEHVAPAVSRFRKAARELGIGVKQSSAELGEGQSRLTVQASEKKAPRTPKASTNGDAAKASGLPKPPVKK